MSSSMLIILSAIIHAAWNSVAKKTSEPYFEVLGIMCFATVFSLFYIPFFTGPLFVSIDSFLWSFASGIFEAGYMITLALSLKQSALGKAYIIMRGMAMIIVWCFSTWLLGEDIDLASFIAIFVVLTGLILTGQTIEANRSKQIIFPLMCGICIAGYHLCYGRSLIHGANPAALLASALWIALPGIVFLIGKKQRRALSEKIKLGWRTMSICGALSTISFLLFLSGLRYAEAGSAITLRNTSIVFAQVFAYFIGEKVSARQWSGAILVTLGASLLYAHIQP